MLSSKEFNTKLQSNNFDELEREYQEAKGFFQSPSRKLKWVDVENKFPAFYLPEQCIMIKFPTYKIRVINTKVSQNELNKMLKDTGNYKIYEETNVVSYPELNPVKSTAIHCLEDNLEDNENTAKEIEGKLKENNINCERWVSYGLYCIPVEVDKDGYILLSSKNS